jgi:membrane protein DedA with SNARE-associated domain
VKPPPLPGELATLAPVLSHGGYWAIGGLVLLEDFGIPVPGETVLIAGAVYAGAGRLSIVVVWLVAFVAAVAGDNIGYVVGRAGGRPLALRYGRYVFLTPERQDKAEAFFARHGGKVVTVARFVEGLRQANGIIAGITGMRWRKFLIFNALGAALWAGLWVTLGDLAGQHIGTIYTEITRYSLYALIAAGIVVLALAARHVVRHRRARRPVPAADAAAADEPPAPPEADDAPASPGAGDRSLPVRPYWPGPGWPGAAPSRPGVSTVCPGCRCPSQPPSSRWK